MDKELLYYYYWNDSTNQAIVYDIQPYRGTTNSQSFTGESYAVILDRYRKMSGEPKMLHSTQKPLKNYWS